MEAREERRRRRKWAETSAHSFSDREEVRQTERGTHLRPGTPLRSPR